MSTVELRDLTKSFGSNQVIPPLNLTIPDGSLTVLLGPSGCGKSTLLRLIAGLEYADSGAVFLDERDVTGLEPRKRNMAMVFQNYALYPHLTVRENLAFPLRIVKIPKETINQKVTHTAELLGLTPLLDRFPKTLSGGERQRTAVGRAIIRDPDLFLFDEPLSNLDFQLRNQMRGELRSLQKRLGKTAIYVTHDQTEAMTMADVLVVLNKGQIAQIGTPSEVFGSPANIFVARFIGTPPMNFIEIRSENKKIEPSEMNSLLSNLDLPSGEYFLGVRPDQIYTSIEDTPLRIIVESTEFHGTQSYSIGSFRGNSIMVLDRLSRKAMPDEKIPLSLDPSNLHIFDRNSGLRVQAGN